MLNDLFLAQKGHHLRGEECIFQQDKAVIYNALIAKKYLLEQKIKLLDNSACSPDLNFVGIACCGGRQYSEISELKNATLDA